MSTGYIGHSEFTYTREDVDHIFRELNLGENSISDAFRSFAELNPKVWHAIKDPEKAFFWIKLIEECADSIRDGTKTSEEYWDKLLDRIGKMRHRVTKTAP